MREDILEALEAEERDGDLTRGRFRFAPDLPVFAGHFPGMPIVPGVYLIEAVRMLAERASRATLGIAAIEDAKFTASVLPGEEMAVEQRVSAAAEVYTCRATVTAAGRTAARIRLRLIPELQPDVGGVNTCSAW